MSHLRDLQRLRNTKNSFQTKKPSGGEIKLNELRVSKKSVHNNERQGYLEPISRILQPSIDPTIYSKYLNSKQIDTHATNIDLVITDKLRHKRGSSFGQGESYSPSKQMPSSSGLSVYNFSIKMSSPPSQSIKVNHKSRQIPIKSSKVPELFVNNDNSPTFKKDKLKKKEAKTSEMHGKKSFEIIYPIGKGGFGKVWKVRCKRTGQIFAMKQMQKVKIIHKKSINSVMNEKALIAQLDHPFLINMTSSFQDRQNLYLVMDYLNGGDLRYHIGCKGNFSQSQTKFFIACIIIGLEYLYEKKIIHRDLKPQNYVMDSDGYLRLTDFGVSRIAKQQNHQDTSGTPGYMSPQVICHKNHSFSADYFAVGVMCYEFMLGKRPYNGRNRKQIREAILTKQVQVKLDELPYKWSPKAADFINQLLQRNPSKRLGWNGIEQLIEHPWLADVEWKHIKSKTFKSPFVPISIDQNYDDYKQQISEDTIDDNAEQTRMMLRDNEVQALFQGYDLADLKQAKGESLRKSVGMSTNNTQSEGQSLRNSWR